MEALSMNTWWHCWGSASPVKKVGRGADSLSRDDRPRAVNLKADEELYEETAVVRGTC